MLVMKSIKEVIAVFIVAVCLIGTSVQFSSHNSGEYSETRLPPDSYQMELHELHAPIPMKDRVSNHTFIQCVYSSIEMIGRWAEEPKLVSPPITSRWNCKTGSSPGTAGRRLRAIGVQFYQVTNKKQGRALLHRAVAIEGRGALFDIPGHAMVILHFDRVKGIVGYVNNSERRTLKVHLITMEDFEKMWGGWVLVVFADNDIVTAKAMAARSNKNPPSDDPTNPGEFNLRDIFPR